VQIENYLFFRGECEDALNFYVQALGGKILHIERYAGTPMDNDQLPPEWKNKVMHSTFECNGGRFMASDGLPGASTSGFSGFAMSIYIPGDKAACEKAFHALAEGGKVDMPYAPVFWGGHFGMLHDKFGVPWMVSGDA
jgi:PhnB protein